MAGGEGNDTFVADDADVLVNGGLGTDTMQLALSASFTAAELVDVEAVTLAAGVGLSVDYTDVNNGTVTDQIATVTGVADGALGTLTITDAANTATTLNYSASNLTLNNVLLEVTGGTGNNIIIGTAGADVINGGAGIDSLTGGTGADTFRVDSKGDAGTYAGGDANANNVMRITDFVVADDTIQLSTATTAYGAGLDLSTLTTVNVANAVTITSTDLADIAAFTAAVQTASAATASTDAVLQAIVVTVNAESTNAGDFDSTSAGTYLIINDNATAAWDAADTIINITGVTGTITSADFAIV
jgi:Ca2+-binding RTX toxin-like protein